MVLENTQMLKVQRQTNQWQTKWCSGELKNKYAKSYTGKKNTRWSVQQLNEKNYKVFADQWVQINQLPHIIQNL